MKKISNEYPVKDIIGQNFYDVTNLVTTNSCEMQRQCINALLSSLMQIEISDDVVLQKNNNRKITYSELSDIIDGNDRYASEIIRYCLQRDYSGEKEAVHI